MRDRPYFFTNSEWWYYDVKEGKVKLTDKAPQEAIDSYKEYYKKSDDPNIVEYL